MNVGRCPRNFNVLGERRIALSACDYDTKARIFYPLVWLSDCLQLGDETELTESSRCALLGYNNATVSETSSSSYHRLLFISCLHQNMMTQMVEDPFYRHNRH